MHVQIAQQIVRIPHELWSAFPGVVIRPNRRRRRVVDRAPEA